MSEARQPEEMADLSDLYATVDKSKKRKSIVDKEESRVTSEICGEISNASLRFLPLNDEKTETLNMSINVVLENLAFFSKVIDTLNVSINDHLNDYNNHIPLISPGYTAIPASCADIIEQNVSSISGYYFLRSHSGQLVSVYCDMKISCDDFIGGWMRVAKLDLQNCPLELRQKVFENDSVKASVVQDNNAGCTS